MRTYGKVPHRDISSKDIESAIKRFVLLASAVTGTFGAHILAAENLDGLTFSELSTAVSELPLAEQRNIWEIRARKISYSPVDWQTQILVIYRPVEEEAVCVLHANAMYKGDRSHSWNIDSEVNYKRKERSGNCARDYIAYEAFTSTVGSVSPEEFLQIESILIENSQKITAVLPDIVDVSSHLEMLQAFEDEESGGIHAIIRTHNCEMVVTLKKSNGEFHRATGSIGEKTCAHHSAAK